ncbi:MAG TPA: Imm27 family immunity protein [Gemmatimonadaceae bacterium]|nr:Imm27 family immunity protein [Gemmatimonadaceae bacterium]
MAAYPELGAEERRLVGAWVEDDGRTLDEVDRRIFWLVTRRLVLRGMAHAGWEQLYQDPRDGRFWELSFPQGSLHGGGPRSLTCVGAEVALEKYLVGPG